MVDLKVNKYVCGGKWFDISFISKIYYLGMHLILFHSLCNFELIGCSHNQEGQKTCQVIAKTL
jgi:hypothetical protein